jgi:hypothetical protein
VKIRHCIALLVILCPFFKTSYAYSATFKAPIGPMPKAK